MQSPFDKGRSQAASAPLFEERPQAAQGEERPGDTRPCPACGTAWPQQQWEAMLEVCPGCGRHERISARRRVEITVDAGTFEELPLPAVVDDPLAFPDYKSKIEKSRKATGLTDALLIGTACVGGHRIALGAMDPFFIMGSMGAAVGEGLAALSDAAMGQGLPMVVFCCSGGARMQEGIVSLMQMAKVSLSVERLAGRKLPFITVLADPTTGGVTASFAMLGDIIIAEPGATIGFTGMRVIQQTIRQELPEGFQRAEFMLEHGFIDLVVPRQDLPRTLATILKLHGV